MLQELLMDSMQADQKLQKLIKLMGTPRRDIHQLSVLTMVFPYGFGFLCEYEDLLGDYPKQLEELGLAVIERSRGRTYFYSQKLMGFYVTEMHPRLNSNHATQAVKNINRLILGYASLGMEAATVKKINDYYSKKLPLGQWVLTVDGIKNYEDPSQEVTILDGLTFVSRSSDSVLISDSYLRKIKEDYPLLNVEAIIVNALQFNNNLTTGQRKTVAGLNTYLRNFLNRSNPALTNNHTRIENKDMDAVYAVFNTWKNVTNSPAKNPDYGQIQKILAPLKNGYTKEQLQTVITNASVDRWFSENSTRMALSFLMTSDKVQQLLSCSNAPQNSGELMNEREEQIITVFKVWAEISDSPAIMPDPSQHQMITQAFNMGYSLDQICQSIHGASMNEWHTGTGRYEGQGTKLTLSILLKSDILQRNLQNFSGFNNSITQDLANENLIQVALNLH